MKNAITIFTDGSSRGNPGPGGWGAIIVYPSGDEMNVKEIGGKESHTTNNRMELLGAIKALEYAKRAMGDLQLAIRVFSDSQYVVKGMTEWLSNWRAKNWKTANKKSVLNRDLWETLSALAGNFEIEWKYVPGHSGHDANERCDEIATLFADGAPAGLFDGRASEYKIKING